ncbi:MAG: phosphate signaling complex protein PhoU, partial [Planctomycetia bacterium]
MSLHFLRQIDRLKQMILAQSAQVEEAVETAMQAVEDRDAEAGRRLVADDDAIDHKEIEIEEEILKTLALYQPVASQLRFVVSMLKINCDLERIGDLAANIAEQAVLLAAQPPGVAAPFNLSGEAQKVRAMLKRALQSLVDGDVGLADWVRSTDDEVDDIHRQMFANVEAAMRLNPEHVPSL